MKIGKLWKKVRGKKYKSRKKNKQLVDTVPDEYECKARAVHSLGVGTFNPDPVADSSSQEKIIFIQRDAPSTVTTKTLSSNDLGFNKASSFSRRNKLRSHMEQISERIHVPKMNFEKIKATFIRVADLNLPSRSYHSQGQQATPNFHHPSNDPPPGVERDSKEQWVALDDGEGSHAPIAPYAIAALADFGLKTLDDSGMWKPEGKTSNHMKQCDLWADAVWRMEGEAKLPESFPSQDEVLVWSGGFIHGHYGSDLPAIRAAGVVDGMSPKALMELLVDSDRTLEYNKLSLGRTDLLVLQDDLNDEGPFGKSITKVMRSESQPPIIRRKLQFTTIMHVKELEDGSGYLLVSRAVTQHQPALIDSNMLRSEILMGVNVLRKIEGQPNKTLMINVNHLKTPMIPLWMGKKIGLSAAPGFFYDLRAICNKK